MPLPRCFFDISINGVPSGRIVFELFADVCPKTCENFRCLCTGEKGEGRTTFKPLHYKSTPIHRVVKGFIIQGGDFSTGDGKGGESIYGGMFTDENFQLKHEQPFLLSMANKGPNTNGSQFFITTRSAPHLDGIHVVFGRVVDGKQYAVEMESQKVDANHRPYADIRITNCGELVLKKATDKRGKAKKKKVIVSSSSDSGSSEEEEESSSEASSSESEREQRRRKRKSKKKRDGERDKKASKSSLTQKKKHSKTKSKKHGKEKKKKRSKKLPSESASEASELDPQMPPDQEEVTSTIPDALHPPPIPSNAWLQRRSRTPSPREGEERRERPKQQFRTRSSETVSRSGRKLKGRGNMHYHTPPRFGDDDGGGTYWRGGGGGEGGYRRGLDRRGSFSPPARSNYRRKPSRTPPPDLRSTLGGEQRRPSSTRQETFTRRSRSPIQQSQHQQKHDRDGTFGGRLEPSVDLGVETGRGQIERKSRWDVDRPSQLEDSFNQRQVEVMSREQVRQRNYHNRYDYERGGRKKEALPLEQSQRTLEQPSSTHRETGGQRHDRRSRSHSPVGRRSPDQHHRRDGGGGEGRRGVRSRSRSAGGGGGREEGRGHRREGRSSRSHSPPNTGTVGWSARKRSSTSTGAAALPSSGNTKWSRHKSHGSTSEEEEEEDRALERAYHRRGGGGGARLGGAKVVAEDIFGIDKLF